MSSNFIIFSLLEVLQETLMTLDACGVSHWKDRICIFVQMGIEDEKIFDRQGD